MASIFDEKHIVIDSSSRIATVPDTLKRVAVQYDHDVETVTFDCPRYWDNLDMSKLKIYVNYMRSDGYLGMYLCTNVTVDSTNNRLMHFDWTISGNVTQVQGPLTFLVCVRGIDKDGNELNHWNSELNTEMYISEGLRCQETILRRYPDIITQLLIRMTECEEHTSMETVLAMVNDIIKNDKKTQEVIKAQISLYLQDNTTWSAAMDEYITSYMETHGIGNIDATLTVSGQAADAKAVGDAIKAAIAQIPKLVTVDALPSTTDSNTYYFIKE